MDVDFYGEEKVKNMKRTDNVSGPYGHIMTYLYHS